MHPLDAAVDAAHQASNDAGLTLTRDELRRILPAAIAAAFDNEAARITADVNAAKHRGEDNQTTQTGPLLAQVLERAGQIYREGR